MSSRTAPEPYRASSTSARAPSRRARRCLAESISSASSRQAGGSMSLGEKAARGRDPLSSAEVEAGGAAGEWRPSSPHGAHTSGVLGSLTQVTTAECVAGFLEPAGASKRTTNERSSAICADTTAAPPLAAAATTWLAPTYLARSPAEATPESEAMPPSTLADGVALLDLRSSASSRLVRGAASNAGPSQWALRRESALSCSQARSGPPSGDPCA